MLRLRFCLYIYGLANLPLVALGYLSKPLPHQRGFLGTAPSSSSSHHRLHASDKNSSQETSRGTGGPFDFLFNPYQSKIPKEVEKDIYEAEGRTPAAKDRNLRVALYSAGAVVGVLLAFFNVFISELRSGPSPYGRPITLESTGFGWVESNFVFQLLFMNKLGGGLTLLVGAALGLLAEAEFDTRRINAEKIWEELQRRRAEKEAELDGQSSKPTSSGRRRRAGKESKRLGALAEVVDNDEEEVLMTVPKVSEAVVQETKPEKVGGFFQTIKGFYEKADSMASAQALLLNKELEDRGYIEKITDETGLRVVGRDAASKLQESGGKDKSADKQ